MDFTELACLRHLHELKADGNRITSLEGLERMDGLVKLSLQGNMISTINCAEFKWFVFFADPALAYSETKIQEPIGNVESEQESPNEH